MIIIIMYCFFFKIIISESGRIAESIVGGTEGTEPPELACAHPGAWAPQFHCDPRSYDPHPRYCIVFI